MRIASALLALALAGFALPAQAIVRGKPVHGLALYGEPKYPANFEHVDYLNPNAPKGGTIRRRAIGTFDSFNAFSFKGNPPYAGIIQYMANATSMYFNEALVVRSGDEPFAQYCLICETMEVAADDTWIEYTLRPQARFHDGTPVTPEDVIFSFESLIKDGHPRFKLYWGDIARAEKTGDRKVRFYFKPTHGTEIPLLIGELPVLSKAFWEKRGVQSALLEPPNASGPYRIGAFEPGRYFVLKRDPNYWGKDLPINRGVNNFDEIRIDYYRDEDVAFRAFLAGEFDIFAETDSTRWSTGYDQRLVDAGAMRKDAFEDGQPDTIHPFVMNIRRARFADIKVREALSLAFDFEGSNRALAYGLMAPFDSFYSGADLASSGLPTGEELAILEKYRGRIPDAVFTTAFVPPNTGNGGNIRDSLLKAQGLLAAAGWEVRGGVLTNAKTGEAFVFEFLMNTPRYEKWIGPYLKNLERLGIKGTIRIIDPTQYINRMNDFDFDMVIGDRVMWGGQSNSPGAEQREQWGSAYADHPGSENWIGIKDPAIDELIEDLIAAPTRESLVAHTHALDRVLLWNHFVVPAYVEPKIWWAVWNKFGWPEATGVHGPNPSYLWYDPALAAKVSDVRARFSATGSGTSRSPLIWSIVAVAGVVALILFRRRRTA